VRASVFFFFSGIYFEVFNGILKRLASEFGITTMLENKIC
jgi:hypothetical protein